MYWNLAQVIWLLCVIFSCVQMSFHYQIYNFVTVNVNSIFWWKLMFIYIIPYIIYDQQIMILNHVNWSAVYVMSTANFVYIYNRDMYRINHECRAVLKYNICEPSVHILRGFDSVITENGETRIYEVLITSLCFVQIVV